MRETSVRSLGWEDPLEKGKERLPTQVFWPREFRGLQSMVSQRVGHGWLSLSLSSLLLDGQERTFWLTKKFHILTAVVVTGLYKCIYLPNVSNLNAWILLFVTISLQIQLIFFFFFLVLPLYCYQPISLHPHAHMLSHVIPRTSACQTPLSMDFSRQEYWSGLLFPSPKYSWFLKLLFTLILYEIVCEIVT